MKKNSTASSAAPHEIAGFSALAGSWWNTQGPYGALHRINPIRLSYIESQIGKAFPQARHKALRLLDVGCGGGLLAEGLAQKGYHVTALDASPETIACARAHAKSQGLKIDYHAQTLENAGFSEHSFDVVIAMELFEHLANRDIFTAAIAHVLKTGGLLITATLNRTWRSYLEAIVAAELILGWVPAGTHDWESFLRPSELAALGEKNGIFPTDVTGLTFSARRRTFEIQKHATDVNYFMTAQKR